MKIIAKHKVKELSHALRINDYLIGIFDALPSRKSIKKAIQRGQIFVNGRIAPSSLFVNEGMLIEYKRSDVIKEKFYTLKLEVIYEDEYFAAVNKPAGLNSSGNQFRTLYNALPLNISPSKHSDALDRPHLVHRLDSATSGLILVAKTANSQLILGNMLKEKQIKKTYLALVHGLIADKGEITSLIDEKKAISEFIKLDGQESSAFQYLSLVKLFPKTGRTHQLRIHMKENGTPILGDRLYRDAKHLLKGKGLFLSAIALEFKHPISNELLKISIEAPKKFKKYWEWTKKRHEKDV